MAEYLEFVGRYALLLIGVNSIGWDCEQLMDGGTP